VDYFYASTKKYLEQLCQKVFGSCKNGSDVVLVALPGQGHVALVESLIGTRSIPYKRTDILKEYFGKEDKRSLCIVLDPRLYTDDLSFDDFNQDFFDQIKNNISISTKLKNLLSECQFRKDKAQLHELITHLTGKGFTLYCFFKTVPTFLDINNKILHYIYSLQSIFSNRFRVIYSFYKYDSTLVPADLRNEFPQTVIYVKPLPEMEVQYQAERFFNEFKKDLPSREVIHQVFLMSGGVAGIMKSLFVELSKGNKEEIFKEVYPLKACAYLEEIKDMLSRQDLIELATLQNSSFNSRNKSYLTETGLADIPMIINYILSQTIHKRVHTDIIIDQKFVKNLSPTLFKLYELFSGNRGKLLTREEIARALWGEDYSSRYSDWAIDRYIADFRKKVHSEIKIITKKRLGYFIE
jgi:hypothetical protein